MGTAFGLYTHIRANRTRSILLLGGLFFLVYVLVFAGALALRGAQYNAPLDWLLPMAWRDLVMAFPWATLGVLFWLLIAFQFHQSMIDALTGGREITRMEEPRLYNLFENLCVSRGLPMPRLKIIDDPALNAFATGLTQRQYAVSVTTGLLGALDDAELEAVLAHELTHIRNGDVRLMVIAVIITGVISFVGELIFRSRPGSGIRFSRRARNGERKGGAGLAILIALALIALAWFLAIVVRFSLSRSREFLADAGAVELTRNPDAMIMALRKIEGRGELPGATSAVMEMCVDNPRQGFADLFATHPSIDRRVEALIRYAGGRDPGPLALMPPAASWPAPPAGPWGGGTPPAGPWGAPGS